MPSYYYTIADTCFRLVTPFPVQVESESVPFLSEEKRPYQDTIIFRAVDTLPEVSSRHDWINDRCYTVLDGSDAVFVRNAPYELPYALITHTAEGIVCLYRGEFERFLRDSTGILNLLGLEYLLLRHGGLMLHASLIRWQGHGILFSAPSGTGKSTQADLWKTFEDSETLNGDRAGIRMCGGTWKAYGMPFAGTSGIYRNESVPITAIVVLEQSPDNVIRRLRPSQALHKLLPECSCRRWDQRFMEQLLAHLISLVQQVPVYLLECRPDRDAVQLLKKTLQEDA